MNKTIKPIKIFTFFALTLLTLQQAFPNNIRLNSKRIRLLQSGKIFSSSSVNDMENGKVQSFELHGQGLHPKNCVYAMRKLSLYEQYKDFLSFVSESTYENQTLNFLLDHTLLPFSMRLKFKIPRIKKAGAYPFTFDAGFLKGLEGKIHLKEMKNKRCLFTLTAKWQGAHSGIPALIFEIFSSTLTELGMKHLFRISRSY